MTETNVAQSLRADQKMDAIMGILLRTGVALAAGIVLIGGIVFLTRHRVPVTDYHVFSGEPMEYADDLGNFSRSSGIAGTRNDSAGVASADCYACGACAVFAFSVFVSERLEIHGFHGDGVGTLAL